LRRDGDAHRVGHFQAMRAGELLFGEEQERELAQLFALRNEGQARRGLVPERFVDAVPVEHAPAAPIRQPAHPRKIPAWFQ